MRGLIVALAVSVVPAVAVPGVAAAVEPSVPLPGTTSVSVHEQTQQTRPPDQASSRALQGNQQAPTTKPGSGTPSATPLSPSATWDLSTHTGDFTWSYPMRVPPAPGGLEPNLTLSYRSSAVDGHTSVTNNQPSWIGDGWDLWPGFIERSYGSCVEDDVQTGDLCWRSDNATASYGGGGGLLIRDDTANPEKWRAKSDNGARIERIRSPGHGNGDNDGEHWKITTVDGTEYWFGSQVDSKSTWTVPVFGDDANEPCHQGSFDASSCDQAWRWNLDKVVDRNGNMIRYFYTTESNHYGRNLKDQPARYIRGGSLEHIEYGLNTQVPGQATGRVEFTTANRCVDGSVCASDKANWPNWPDVPWDHKCDEATCKDRYSPTFWTTQRLAVITTKVLRGSGYEPVDRWTLQHLYPGIGDVGPTGREAAALWLKSIAHTGLVGGSVDLPPVTFEGAQMGNRVDGDGDGFTGLNRYRIVGVISEAGGLTTVNYEPPDCTSATKPAKAETNGMRCYPVRWTPPRQATRTDYFHKYVVKSITQSDQLGTSTTQVTSYEYLDGAAWHWDMSEMVKDKNKTWNEFRGFKRVRVRTGTREDPGRSPVTLTEHRFYQGMDGDKWPVRDNESPPTGRRSVTFRDSAGFERTDHDWLHGSPVETSTFDDQARPAIARTITEPSWHGPTASRGPFQAYIVGTGVQRGFTALAGGAWRETRTETRYDYDDNAVAVKAGRPIQVNDLGDVGTTEDDRCTRTTYASNTGRWLLNLPREVKSVSVHCGQTPRFPGHALGASRNSYDGNGNLTRTEVADTWPAADPVYVTTGTADHDVHGRVVAATDALGQTSRLAFTPATGGPVTQTTATTPVIAALKSGLTTVTTVDPAFGQPTRTVDPNQRVTEIAYDPLGRAIQAWLPDRPRDEYGDDSNLKFSYLMRRDAPSVVTTTKVGPNGEYTSSNSFYDGLLRLRQVQTPGVGMKLHDGQWIPFAQGRLLTDTRYDTHGRVYKASSPYFNDAPVDTNLWFAADNEAPSVTRTRYDGAGRVSESIFQGGAIDQWKTVTQYEGDRVHVTPPAGGTATTTITDARGRTTELRQYHGPTPTGDYDTTRYRHTPADQLAEVTGPDGAVWKFGYDLRGRKTSSTDPDSGSSTMGYDNADRLTSTRDAVQQVLAYAYDPLGRRTAVHADSLSGTKLSEWTYDTSVFGKGLPASSTRFVAGQAYTSTVHSYTALNLPLKTSVTIPAVEGPLARTYTSEFGYGADGSVTGETYPEIPGIPELPKQTIHYQLDDWGRPLSTKTGAGLKLVAETFYTRYGEVERLVHGTSPTRAWQSFYYDTSTRRLNRSIVDAEVPAPMQTDTQYTYDHAGTVTSVADLMPDRTDIQCFRHDHLRRLTEAWTPAQSAWKPNTGCTAEPAAGALAGPAPYWHSYRHDKGGNRTEETQRTPTAITKRTYNYTNPAQPHTLRTVTGPTGAEAYNYNPLGQTISRTKPGTQQSLTWDREGHLTSLTDNNETTSFIYTPDGGRLLRKDPDGTTTLYLGNQEIRSANGKLTATRYYTHGGATVAMHDGTALTWLAGDHQGTSQVAVNSATLVTTRRHQLPYGAPRGVAPVWPNDRGFLGGTQDPSGLTHLGARDYDPSTGRFISLDPIMDVADPQQMHGYAYANNNPITFSDPTGLKPCNWDESCVTEPTPGGWKPPAPPPPPEPTLGSDAPGETAEQKRERDLKVKLHADKVKRRPVLGLSPETQILNNGTLCELYIKDAQTLDTCKANASDPDFDKNQLHSHGVAFLGAVADGIAEFLTEVAIEIITSGRGKGGTSRGKSDPERPSVRGGKCSFDGDTQVLMADGTTKAISDIGVGDEVLAADPETGEKGARMVTAHMVHEDTVVDLVTEDGAKVTTTEDHPFWNATDRQWQRADQLDRGDSLLSDAGQLVKVVGLRLDGARPSVAYNLTVKDIHTFHVLAGGRPVLVHNTCPRFVHDAWWEDRVVLSDGNEYVFGGFVEDNGTTTLNLWDVYVWPADRKGTNLGANRGALGTGGAAELMRMIYNRYLPQARLQGYTHLRIQGTRVTGGKQGHVFDETFPRRR